MGWRFHRVLNLGLIKINFSKTGLSLSVGVPGLTFNFGKRGVTRTIGLPGTGISHRQHLSGKDEDVQDHS